MTDKTKRTALVTGANSGLGFEAAAQLADQGYGRVIVAARTEQKAQAARDQLLARTSKDIFETLTLDNDDPDTIAAAVKALADRGGKIDFLLLNAGVAPDKELVKTAAGVEATFSATLIGHHLLTMQLLDEGLLSDEGRIVIAGSEAARGDVPMFKPVDINEYTAENFDGNFEAAVESLIRMDGPFQYHPGNTYATVKLFAAWWAAELAAKLPQGVTVNAVSPGSTPDTNAVRNAPFLMKRVLIPFFKIVPGMSHEVGDGASRYLQASEFGPEVTGKFFASKPKKMTGPLVDIKMDHFNNPAAQKAVWNVTTKVAGGVG